MDSLKEFIEKIKLWILDKIEDIRIFLGEQIVKVKEFVDKLKNRDSVPG